MIKIVIDSTFYLPKEFCVENDIRVVPLFMRLNGEEYAEGYPGEYKSFFDKVSVGKSFPQTACPSPEDFKKVFDEILNEGHEVLCLCLTSKISGTYQSAKIAAEGLDKITVVDTRTSLAGARYMTEKTVEYISGGLSREEIINAVKDIPERADLSCLPINLDYFIKGGRVKGIAAIIGKLARIKPIICMRDGRLVPEKKVFTLASGEAYLLSKIEKAISTDTLEKLYFGYTYGDKYMKLFKQKVFARFPEIEAIAEDYEIGPVIGTHIGPYSFGPLIISKR